MNRNTAIYLLRSMTADPEMKERFPKVSNNTFINALNKIKFDRLFWYVTLLLPYRYKVAIYNRLINRFHIPYTLVPPEKLKEKYKQGLTYLKERGIPLGDYLEFGVYQGTSLLCMYDAMEELKIDNMRLWGFDSFKGFPAPSKIDKKLLFTGDFKADISFTKKLLNERNIDWRKVFLIKGFFHDTLNIKLVNDHNIQKASVIMIDCDMYSSAKESLNFCTHLIKDETIILFDDWNCTGDEGGERKAFAEFLEKNPHLVAREFGTYYHNAQVFLVINKKTHVPLLDNFQYQRFDDASRAARYSLKSDRSAS